jgi:hypothetical protein
MSPANPLFSFNDLERVVSVARAARYLESTKNNTTGQPDPAAALVLYEHNTFLSGAAWTTIIDVEVVLRNLISEAISTHHDAIRPGPLRWYDDPSWLTPGRPFTAQTTKAIASAMSRAKDSGPLAGGPRPGEGRVVAELSLGFWRYLLIARYEHSLWNPTIRQCFPALQQLSGADSRKSVYAVVEKLNYLRNRVAHHEPIYEPFHIPGHTATVDPGQTLTDAIELISWNDPTAASWISTRRTHP